MDSRGAPVGQWTSGMNPLPIKWPNMSLRTRESVIHVGFSQPRVAAAPVRSRLRHYSRLSAMAGKLSRLMAAHEWGRVDAVAVREAARLA